MAWDDERLRTEVIEQFADATAWSSRDATAFEAKLAAQRRAQDAERKQDERSGRLAVGLCARCPMTLDPKSKRHCTKHHEENRDEARKRRQRMREKLPDERRGDTHHFTLHYQVPSADHDAEPGVASVDCYLQTGLYDDGRVGEVFLKVGKAGGDKSWVDQWAIAFSIALQHGAALEDLCRKFRGQRFEPSGATSNPKIPRCSSLADYVAQWLTMKYGPQEQLA